MHLERQLEIFFFGKTCSVHVAESGTLANFILAGNLSVDDFHNHLAFCLIMQCDSRVFDSSWSALPNKT